MKQSIPKYKVGQEVYITNDAMIYRGHACVVKKVFYYSHNNMYQYLVESPEFMMWVRETSLVPFNTPLAKAVFVD